jgi:hypothetical protein
MMGFGMARTLKGGKHLQQRPCDVVIPASLSGFEVMFLSQWLCLVDVLRCGWLTFACRPFGCF